MYSKNSIGKRRLPGWAERRRHFRSYFEQLRAKAAKDDTVAKTATPVVDKD
jgi:hypothetical protein